MIVGNMLLFKKKATHVVTYVSFPSKGQVDYCLVRRNQRKFLKDRKALPSEECVSKHRPLVCDFRIR